MPDTPVTLAAIRETRGLLGDRIHHTPMLSSATAARFVEGATGVRIADGRLYLKAEHLQKTGSFKARAALARISSLTADERARGAITISAGNAGQAYAWAGCAGRRAGDGRHAARRRRVEGRRLPRVRRGGRPPRRPRRRVARAPRAAAGGARPDARPPVRRPRGPARATGRVGLEILEDLPDVDVVVLGDRRRRPDRRRGDGDQGAAGRRSGSTASSRSGPRR